jgi:polysaccharide export outer membrane protein
MASRCVHRAVLVGAVMVCLAMASLAAQTGRVGLHDKITVTVFGDERLSGQFVVDGEGMINYASIGAVKVAGLTAREIEVEIGKRLKQADLYTVLPPITVELVQLQNKAVLVNGAVRQPMRVTFAGEFTVMDAVLGAGGPTSEAGDDVRVIRPPARTSGPGGADADVDPEIIPLKLSELMSGRVSDRRALVQDGDIVLVDRSQAVTITGAVQTTGAYRVEPGTNVRTAVAQAGGIAERGTWRGVRIIRDGKDVKNVTQETLVKPGDTIIVKRSAL